LGATLGAAAVAAVVAVAVMAMVSFGGGVRHPLVTPHVAAVQPAPAQG
jgi:hypothetical protein